MVYNLDKRHDTKGLKEYARDMVLGKESFPVFKLNKEDKEAV